MILKARFCEDLRVVIHYLLGSFDRKGSKRPGPEKRIQGELEDLLFYLAHCPNKSGWHIMGGDYLTDSADLVYADSSLIKRYNLCWSCNEVPLDFRYATILHATENNSIDLHTVVHQEFVSSGLKAPIYAAQKDKKFFWNAGIYISEREGLTIPYLEAPNMRDHTYADEWSSEAINQRNLVHDAVLTDFHHGLIESREDVIASIIKKDFRLIEDGGQWLTVGTDDMIVRMEGQFYRADFSAAKMLENYEQKKLEILNSRDSRRKFVHEGIRRRLEDFQKVRSKYSLNPLALKAQKRKSAANENVPDQINLDRFNCLWSRRLSSQTIRETINQKPYKEYKNEIPTLSRILGATRSIGRAISGIVQLTELVSNFAAAEQAVERERKVEVGRKDIGASTPYEFLSEFSFACTRKEPMQPEAPEGPVNEELVNDAPVNPSMDMGL